MLRIEVIELVSGYLETLNFLEECGVLADTVLALHKLLPYPESHWAVFKLAYARGLYQFVYEILELCKAAKLIH